jgi:FkbM family methyltransferase
VEVNPIDHPWQWYGGHSYAQHGDDLIILNIFQRLGMERPSYLDIGAYHPFIISNTALLYERGCRGINVEPNPALIEAFKVHRPEDTNLGVAVGPARCTGALFVTDPQGGRSSLVLRDPRATKVEVDVLTVAEIVAEYAHGAFPDLLTVDTEGFDAKILGSIRFNGPGSPKVVCAEMATEVTDDADAIRELMKRAGYFPYCWAGSNMFFVHNDFTVRMY